jgi:hypothetical protein
MKFNVLPTYIVQTRFLGISSKIFFAEKFGRTVTSVQSTTFLNVASYVSNGESCQVSLTFVAAKLPIKKVFKHSSSVFVAKYQVVNFVNITFSTSVEFS